MRMKISLAQLGLRSKSLLALSLLNLVTLLFALLLGNLSLDDLRQDLGASYALSRAQLNQQIILGKLQPELTLARRFAASTLTRRWLADEENPEYKRLFFEEAEGYRQSFSDRFYFVVSAKTLNFHHNDNNQAFSEAPRYRISLERAEDAWYAATLERDQPYNINIDTDRALRTTRVWINVPVRDAHGKALGVAGSGLDFHEFLRQFIQNSPHGVTSMILDQRGLIQAHPNPEMVEYAAVGKESGERTLRRLLATESERLQLDAALASLLAGKTSTQVIPASIDGRKQQLALAYLPELHWFVVSAVDLQAFSLFDNRLIQWSAAAAVAILLTLLALTLGGFDRMVLTPLARLTRSVREVAGGAYHVRLHSRRQDEIGELARTFDQMAQNVLDHTTHLEERVSARTFELQEANRRLDEAHRQLTDSIDCAALFQRALLPTAQVRAGFPGEFEALWLPRDVVGGDLYVYRPLPGGALLALMDCAGHGVPGAFMTMIAHAALDVALAEQSAADPAALLVHYDATLRAMMPARQRFGQVSSDMDLALCHFDFTKQELSYAGARIALHWIDAQGHHQAAPSRRNVGGNKAPTCENVRLPLTPAQTYFLSTDGLLDQNGGEQGFAFGEKAFADLLLTQAHLPLEAQMAGLQKALNEYRGTLPQRDDVAVVAFRYSPPSSWQAILPAQDG